MKSCITATFWAVLVILLVACGEEEVSPRDYPRLLTHDVSDIAESGAQFNAEIVFRGSFEIVSYGFVWSEAENPALEDADKVVYVENVQSDRFSAKISTTLEEGVTYYVRPFVKTMNYTVYGKSVKFLSLGSLAPTVHSFFPKTGTWGDTIRIYGERFSYLIQKNDVLLGDIPTKVVEASDTTLTVIVPPLKNDKAVKLKVSVSGNTTTARETFNYLIPRIQAVYSLTGTFGDTVTIKGENFSSYQAYNSVHLGEVSSEIVTTTPTELKFLVPEEVNEKESQLTLTSSGIKLEYHENFVLLAPSISSIEPEVITRPNEIISIHGRNFNPTGSNNRVHIGGFEVKVVQASNDSLKVYLPAAIIPNHSVSVFTNVAVKVTIAEQSAVSSQDLEVYWHSTWTRKQDFPGLARHNAVAFSIDGKGYLGTGITRGDLNGQLLSDFWEYNPSEDTWTQVNDFPGSPRVGGSAFVVDRKGYVGLGSENYYWDDPAKDRDHFSDFYRYDPATGSWVRVADFGGNGRHSAASFVANNEGYIVTGWWGESGPNTNLKIAWDAWKYNPLSNNWTEIKDFPNASDDAAGFSINGEGYIYDYNKLYKFVENRWQELNAPELKAWDNVAFSIGSHAYFGLGMPHRTDGTNALWEYNPVTGESINRPLDYKNKRWGASVFVLGEKAYIIGGATYTDERIILKDVWEFDPTKPEI